MLSRSAIRALAIVAATAALAACAVPSPAPTYPEVRFTHLQPYNLDVAKVEVFVGYQPPLASPNVDHLSPLPPAAAAENWAKDRFRAVGTSGSARVIVSKGAVVEQSLKRTEGVVQSVLTKDQVSRYDGALEVTVEIRSDRGFREGYVTAAAERSRSVAEDATLNQREKLWFGMSEDLIREINAQMEKTIPNVLQRWLR